MSKHLTSIAAALALLLGGTLSALDRSLLGGAAVVIAAAVLAARATAALHGIKGRELERTTAWGFYAGILAGVVLLVLGRL